MVDTYTQIYIQIIFSVQNRLPLINSEWEEDLYKYISGFTSNKGQKMLQINGTSNHLHILVAMTPDCCLSDFVRELKKSSNQFIKKNGFVRSRFRWQRGYSAFSYDNSDLDEVINYIRNQKEHHKRVSLRDEHLTLLKEFGYKDKAKYVLE